MNIDTLQQLSQGEIIVVEDNTSDLRLMLDILKNAGYQVRPATDGELALRSVQARHPDLILLDVNLPDMSGVEVCRRLKADPETREIPVIFISALDKTDLKVKALEGGGIDYVTKPVEPSEVLARIGTHLNMYRLRQRLEAQSDELRMEIKERRQVEEELEKHREHLEELVEKRTATLLESESRLRMALEAAIAGTWEWDLKTNRKVWSDELYRLYDLDPDTCEASYDTWRESIFPDDRAAVEAAVLTAVNSESKLNVDWRVNTADGSLRRLMSQGRPVRNAEGRVTKYQGIVIDVSERKQAEEKLAESRTKLEAALAGMTDAVFISDEQGRFIDFNNAFATFHRFKSKDDCARTLSDYPDILEVYTDNGEPVPLDMWAVPRALRGETVTNAEYTLRRKDSGETWVGSYSFSPIRNKDNTIIGSVVVGRDITERKQAEAEKLKLEAQFHQAQKMESVGRLAGGVAHDFNNMLNVIIGHAELALEQVDASHPIVDSLIEIRQAAERSANLTRQLLAFARKQTIAPKVLDLNETVESMLKMLRRLIGEDIQIVWLPGPNMWSISMDPSQIDQILANLCVNARDAIEGVGNVTIETGIITVDEIYCHDHPGFIPGDFVILVVSDNGCGMNNEILDKLFEPFFTTKEMGKGTGLGLATIFGIVKQNNGFINVYSEPGHGTTFRIYLPRYGGRNEQKTMRAKTEPLSGGHETILLVEDEAAILKLATMMLERLGYTVFAASTPGEAILLANEYKGEIHLLITDVVMPEMNGRDLSNRLIHLYPNLKCLFMSGYTADVIAHHGVLEKGVEFINKPFSNQDLATKVRDVLG